MANVGFTKPLSSVRHGSCNFSKSKALVNRNDAHETGVDVFANNSQKVKRFTKAAPILVLAATLSVYEKLTVIITRRPAEEPNRDLKIAAIVQISD